MTLATFLKRYPEFSADRAPAELIQECLNEAARTISGSGWGDQLDDAIGLQAAHLISTSPWGQQARLTKDGGGTSTYGVELERRKAFVFPLLFVSRY